MSPLEIKVDILKHGFSQAGIASSIGVSRQEVWNVINGNRTTRRVRIVIAKAINKPLLEVFPSEAFREPYGRIMKRKGATA